MDYYRNHGGNDYYEFFERNDKTCKLITGRITGINKACAYCSYGEHPGYLTVELEEKKGCLKKECHHHKPTQGSKKGNTERDILKRAEKIAREETVDLEGMRITGARWGKGGIIVNCAAIAAYDLSETELRVEKKAGVRVMFRAGNFNFDEAAAIVFGKEAAGKGRKF